MRQTIICAALASLTLAQQGPDNCIHTDSYTCKTDDECCEIDDFCHSDGYCRSEPELVQEVMTESVCVDFGGDCMADSDCCIDETYSNASYCTWGYCNPNPTLIKPVYKKSEPTEDSSSFVKTMISN